MRKGQIPALLISILIIGLALMRTATASHTVSHKAFSGGSTFRGLVVKTDSAAVTVETTGSEWQTIDSRGFQIPAGESQLVVLRFFAETVCLTDGACLARGMIGRTLAGAVPLEPEDGFFTLDHSGGSGDDQSEGHSMSRALCVKNPTSSALDISVWVQARESAGTTFFSLDDWTMEISRNASCSPSVDL